MKTRFFKVGGRTLKTVVAVFLCFLIDTLRNGGVPFYAAIAAVLCVQRTPEDSLRAALNREIATLVGGAWGMLVLLFEKYIYSPQNELLRYLALSLLLIPLINLSVALRRESGTFLMCVVFLCVTVTHGHDGSPIAFAFARIIDTTIGVAVALLVNQFPLRLKSLFKKRGSASEKELDEKELP